MFTLLHQCHLRWQGHVHRMEDGCIPKDLLYSDPTCTTGATHRGCPQLCFKDICKYDLKPCNIDTKLWEAFADDRNKFFDLKSCNIDTKLWEALADDRNKFFDLKSWNIDGKLWEALTDDKKQFVF